MGVDQSSNEPGRKPGVGPPHSPPKRLPTAKPLAARSAPGAAGPAPPVVQAPPVAQALAPPVANQSADAADPLAFLTVEPSSAASRRGSRRQTPEPAAEDKPRKRRRGQAVGVREELDELKEEGYWTVWFRDFRRQNPCWLTSMAVHFLLVVAMGLYMIPLPKDSFELVVSASPTQSDFEEIPSVLTNQLDPEPGQDPIDRPDPESLQPKIDMKNASEGINASSVALSALGTEKAPWNDMLSESGRGTGIGLLGTGKGKQGTGFGLLGNGMGLGGRGGRRGRALGMGATPASESAVDLALKWLANHQNYDGSWNFDHRRGQCENRCANPGTMTEATMGATAMGVLPFLGAGNTHRTGKYQRNVQAALQYLMTHMKVSPQGGSMHDPGGRMYSHGMAAIALCEAYGMAREMGTRRTGESASAYLDEPGGRAPAIPSKQAKAMDAALGAAAQQALNFIVSAQDKTGGGWRYEPNEPGDTSVVGWQIMALTSGRMSYLVVPPGVFANAERFLDSVQYDSGAAYGYLNAGAGTQATSAIGLLCRMYLGWKRDNPAIERGVQNLSRQAPSRDNMYYNYYATQVMHHYEGEPWKQWNDSMRDYLVGTQDKNGHQAGSWYLAGGDHGTNPGGRLYFTSMAALTLEVYYRHLPLYNTQAFATGGEKAEAKNAAKGKKKAEETSELDK